MVTAKGQITIPQNVRQALNLKKGDRVVFMLEGEQAILIPVRQREMAQLRGALSSPTPFTSHQDIRDTAARKRGEELDQEDKG
jgi:AbrB family looped-hinge helix DNA binding protein